MLTKNKYLFFTAFLKITRLVRVYKGSPRQNPKKERKDPIAEISQRS